MYSRSMHVLFVHVYSVHVSNGLKKTQNRARLWHELMPQEKKTVNCDILYFYPDFIQQSSDCKYKQAYYVTFCCMRLEHVSVTEKQ